MRKNCWQNRADKFWSFVNTIGDLTQYRGAEKIVPLNWEQGLVNKLGQNRCEKTRSRVEVSAEESRSGGQAVTVI